MMSEMLQIALPKGRLGEKVYKMFAEAGYECPEALEDTRKLIFENKEAGVCYFWVKPSDVAIYVERGAADIGVAGKDILMESKPEVFELLDLNMGKCRLAVAGKVGFYDRTEHTLRVATKFPNITMDYYGRRKNDDACSWNDWSRQGKPYDCHTVEGIIEYLNFATISFIPYTR